MAKQRSNHHLIPKFRLNYRDKKIETCLDCHQNIHRLFKNGELYEDFNTVNKLKIELQHRLMQEGLSNWFHANENSPEEIQEAIHDWFHGDELLEEDDTVAQIAEHLPCIINDTGERKVVGATPVGVFSL